MPEEHEFFLDPKPTEPRSLKLKPLPPEVIEERRQAAELAAAGAAIDRENKRIASEITSRPTPAMGSEPVSLAPNDNGEDGWICTTCRSQFQPKRHRVSGVITIAFGVLFMASGVITLGFSVLGAILPIALGLLLSAEGNRGLKGNTKCPSCESKATIPIDTPAGQELRRKKPR